MKVKELDFGYGILEETTELWSWRTLKKVGSIQLYLNLSSDKKKAQRLADLLEELGEDVTVSFTTNDFAFDYDGAVETHFNCCPKNPKKCSQCIELGVEENGS